MKPTPAFTPSVGRQVQFCLNSNLAQAVNSSLKAQSETRKQLILATGAAASATADDKALLLSLPCLCEPYKEGDYLSATITRLVHDGECDLMVQTPVATFPVFNVKNEFGPLGYLYFNQVDSEPPTVSYQLVSAEDGSAEIVRQTTQKRAPYASTTNIMALSKEKADDLRARLAAASTGEMTGLLNTEWFKNNPQW